MTSAIFRNAESRNVIARGYEVLLQDTPQARPHRVPTRFGETHMLVAGPEHAPPLVIIHGALVNSAVAMREAHPLLERFRVYALDVIGQSVKSADVRLRWDGADYANWLLDVLDGLGLAKAHFCGASSGGVIARILAEHAPERIDRLVLLVPAGIVKPPARQVMMKIGIPMMLYRTMGSRKALARFLDSLLTSSDQRLEEYMGAALQHYKIDFSLPPFARVEALAGFRRPTLVIGASEDITVPGAALLQRARELFPQAALELIPDWKHTPPTDDVSRAKLCGLIASFLLAEDAAPSRAAG